MAYFNAEDLLAMFASSSDAEMIADDFAKALNEAIKLQKAKEEEEMRAIEEAKRKAAEEKARKKLEEEARFKAEQARIQEEENRRKQRLAEIQKALQEWTQREEEKQKENKNIHKRNKARTALTALWDYLTESFGVEMPASCIDDKTIEDFITGVDDFWKNFGNSYDKDQIVTFTMDSEHPNGEIVFKDNLSGEEFTIHDMAEFKNSSNPLEIFLKENGLK